MTEYKELPIEFNRDSYIFKQVHRRRIGYIYEQINPESGKVISYEAFRRKVSNGGDQAIGGKMVRFEPRVRYPSNESFGSWAWSVPFLSSAIDKLESFPEPKISI